MSEIPFEPLPPAVARQILQAVASVQYGSVEVIVHNAKVVRLERKEKLLLDECDPHRKPS